MNRFSLLFTLLAFTAATAVALQGASSSPPPAFACTGAHPDLDDAARRSDVIAIVEATAIGGAENLSPTQTPVTVTPIAGLPTPNPQRTQFDLTGVGAVVRPVQVLKGSLPPDARIDDSRRAFIEKELRRFEANPYAIGTSCELDFLLQRYELRQRYLVFLNRGEQGGWDTALRYRIAGDYVITGGIDSEADPPLRMTTAIKDRFFPSIPAQGPFAVEEWRLSYWVLTSPNAPLQAVIDATRAVLAGEIPGPMTPTPTLSPGVSATPHSPLPPTGISPPSVGEAGLR